MVMCKTDVGTLCANSYGNHWNDEGATTCGIGLGIYGNENFAFLEYHKPSGKLMLVINKKYLKENGIEIISDCD